VLGTRHSELQGQWGGSVLDSVIGAYVTQAVSDVQSSTAFMNLAATWPGPASPRTRQQQQQLHNRRPPHQAQELQQQLPDHREQQSSHTGPILAGGAAGEADNRPPWYQQGLLGEQQHHESATFTALPATAGGTTPLREDCPLMAPAD
jgi:hypothetical protein